MMATMGKDIGHGLHERSSARTPADGASVEEVATLVATVRCGVENGTLAIELSAEGEGGTYFVVPNARRSPNGATPLAVFKPAAEEIGTSGNPRGNTQLAKNCFSPGEGFKCEVLAFELDHGGFAGVPETRVVELQGRVGSLQRFVPGCIESWDTTPGRLSAVHVRRIAIFDLRVLNCDRHGGNILVAGSGARLVPIDHSYILPHGWSDPEFEWMDWPQAKVPFAPDELEYIAVLDASRDRALVVQDLGEESGDVLFACTRLLQRAAPRGYTASALAHFCRRETITQPSGLEVLLAECRDEDSWELDPLAVDACIDLHFPPKEGGGAAEEGD